MKRAFKEQHKIKWQRYRYTFLAATIGIYIYFYYLFFQGNKTPLWLFWWAWFGIVLILLPAIFGRWGCGWMCMYSAAMEFCTNRLPHKRLDLPKWMKSWYFLYIFFMAFGTCEIFWDLDFYIWYIFIVDTVAVSLGLLIIPRYWCRYICPLGTGSMVYGRIRTFGLQTDPSKCKNCKVCNWGKLCPMLINGKTDVVEKGRRSVPTYCILCMKCVEHCPGHVPRFGRVRWLKQLIPQPQMQAEKKVEVRAA